jgi:hypothetical protein
MDKIGKDESYGLSLSLTIGISRFFNSVREWLILANEDCWVVNYTTYNKQNHIKK